MTQDGGQPTEDTKPGPDRPVLVVNCVFAGAGTLFLATGSGVVTVVVAALAVFLATALAHVSRRR